MALVRGFIRWLQLEQLWNFPRRVCQRAMLILTLTLFALTLRWGQRSMLSTSAVTTIIVLSDAAA